eukprot:c26477_g1_i1.p3 GENE.c26477_g1_i1~~c26477_g1_i1.p3  ORF type:complete len:141 (+),score=21.36 c26477_g1_i1:92-514(+)
MLLYVSALPQRPWDYCAVHQFLEVTNHFLFGDRLFSWETCSKHFVWNSEVISLCKLDVVIDHLVECIEVVLEFGAIYFLADTTLSETRLPTFPQARMSTLQLFGTREFAHQCVRSLEALSCLLVSAPWVDKANTGNTLAV